MIKDSDNNSFMDHQKDIKKDVDVNGDQFSLKVTNLETGDSGMYQDLSKTEELGTNVKPSGLMWFSFLVMVTQSLNYGLGMAVGNNTQALIQEYFGLSDDQFTWVTSLLPLGGVFGGVFGGKIVDIFGPKMTSIYNDFGYAISVAILASSQNYAMLLAGRFILGFFIGITCACVPQYVAEITPTQWRGILGVGHQQNITIGILIVSIIGMQQVLGTWDLWRLVWGAPLVPAVIHFCLMWFTPESPFWLYRKGRKEEGESVLKSLRNDAPEKIAAEFKMMEDEDQKARQDAEDDLPLWDALKLIFTTKSLFVPFLMALYQQFAQQFSGINAIIFYSTSVFQSANTGLSAEATTVLTMGINSLAGFCGFFLLAYTGRKGALLLGFAGMAIFHVLFAVTQIVGGSSLATAGIVFILLYIICFAVGPGPVPWMITADLIPSKVRSLSLGLAVAVNWLSTFAIGRIFPPMNDAIQGWSFIVFASISGFSFFIFLFFLIETDGMTRAQIDNWFESGHILAPNYFRRRTKK
eukprot:Pgem_evm1s20084